jgi:threonine/homoserine/homoserine lactone efflux protein
MLELLPPWPLLAAFVVAAFVLAVTPGPGVAYIVARSIAQGRRSGLASVLGVALGNFGNATGAALGLGALFAVSSTAFMLVKYAGAAYLIYLGVEALRARRRPETGEVSQASAARVLRDGFLVALLNPKTALFFFAFLPQFMTPEAAAIPQAVLLGALFVLIAMCTDAAYALAAAAIAPLLRRATRAPSLGRLATGGTFIGLGVFAAIGEPRPSGQ